MAQLAKSVPMNANEFIEQQLDDRLLELEREFKAHAVSFVGDLVLGVDNLFRSAIEKKRQENGDRKLVVFITTFGGYIEVVHRIVDTLRHHYRVVDFVIPDYAG
jgi:ATP-dependent protease ClpP protease subunit